MLITLEDFRNRVSIILSDNLSLFRGFTIADISIDSKITASNVFYNGTQSSVKNYKVSILINPPVAKAFVDSNPLVGNNAKYDITIDKIYLNNYNSITIVASSVKETGLSDRELLERRLYKYCKDFTLLPKIKKPLPRVVINILAVTSSSSTIDDDIYNNNGLLKENSTQIVKCRTSEEIAAIVKNADQSFDIVVLYRGGHQDDAMNIFSHESIIDAISGSSLPVAVALGHDVDSPFIYNLADYYAPAPVGFAKQILSHNVKAKTDLFSLLGSIKNSLDAIKLLSLSKVEVHDKAIEKHLLLALEKKSSRITALLESSDKYFYQHLKTLENRHTSTLQSIASSISSISGSKIKDIAHRGDVIVNMTQTIALSKTATLDKLKEGVSSSLNTIRSAKDFSQIATSINNSVQSIISSKLVSIEKVNDSIDKSIGGIRSSKESFVKVVLMSIETLSERAHKEVESKVIFESIKRDSEIALAESQRIQKRNLLIVVALFTVVIIAIILYI